MADNITAPAAGSVLATDDISGVHYPRTKISIGADGAASDVSTSNPLPVSGTFWQATQPVSLADPVEVTGEFYPATQPVSGNVGVTGSVAVTGTFWQATQPVSIANPVAVTGTFYPATQPISAASLPLPTGAATETTSARTTPAGRWAAISPGASTLSPVPKAVWVNQACTVTMEGSDSIAATFTMTSAGPLPGRPTKITAVSTGTVIGLYD